MVVLVSIMNRNVYDKKKKKGIKLLSDYKQFESLEEGLNLLIKEKIDCLIEDLSFIQKLMKNPELKKELLFYNKKQIEMLKFLGVEF
jgi:hypothetical protein